MNQASESILWQEQYTDDDEATIYEQFKAEVRVMK